MLQRMHWIRGVLAAAALALMPLPAAATAYVEVGDTGDVPGTAQHATGSGVLTEIIGAVSAEPFSLDLVDLYALFIPDPSAFSADTGDGSDPNLLQDPVLYLFDHAGRGVSMNDDGPFPPQSALGALPLGFGPGFYYLAISFAGVTPVDALSNDIFDAFGSLAVLSNQPLHGWIGAPLTQNTAIAGDYDITLAGALFVPEPGSLLLVAAALLLGFARRTRHV